MKGAEEELASIAPCDIAIEPCDCKFPETEQGRRKASNGTKLDLRCDTLCCCTRRAHSLKQIAEHIYRAPYTRKI